MSDKENSQKIDLHAVTLATLSAQMARLLEVMNKVEVYLFTGNGVPPLTERVRVLEECAAENKSSRKDRAAFWAAIASGAISSILAGFLLYRLNLAH